MTAMPIFSQRATRVRATQVEQPQKEDAFALCMACWVDFMTLDDRDSGASRMRLHGRDGGDSSDGDYQSDPYAEQRAADLKTGEAVNAAIDSLTAIHRWSIYRSQGITTQWRFPNADYMQVLLVAREELEKKLRNNIATRVYFV